MRLSKKARQQAAQLSRHEAAALSIMAKQLKFCGLISDARSTAIWRVLSKHYDAADFERANDIIATLMVAPWRINEAQPFRGDR